MEATGNVGAVQPLQSQITAMTAYGSTRSFRHECTKLIPSTARRRTMAESEEDVIRRRLAAVEKLEKMLLEVRRLFESPAHARH